MKALLKYWPTGNSGKELCFLNEIEDIMEHLVPQDILPFRDVLFKRIAKCLGSPNNQVAERTLCLWSSASYESVVMKDKDNVKAVARIVYPALRKCSEESENVSIRQMAQHVIGLFVDRCFDEVDALSRQYENEQSRV